jgi:hypothetical protein
MSARARVVFDSLTGMLGVLAAPFRELVYALTQHSESPGSRR